MLVTGVWWLVRYSCLLSLMGYGLSVVIIGGAYRCQNFAPKAVSVRLLVQLSVASFS